jgi:hypothetical protein
MILDLKNTFIIDFNKIFEIVSGLVIIIREFSINIRNSLFNDIIRDRVLCGEKEILIIIDFNNNGSILTK